LSDLFWGIFPEKYLLKLQL